MTATRMVYRNRRLLTMCNALAAWLVTALALTLTTTARAATIIVDSLADTGAPGICVLRDAITAANALSAVNGCGAGDGKDTIQFGVVGRVILASTLPTIMGNLTIGGPGHPGITIDGGGQTQVIQVASGATLNLNHLIISGALGSSTQNGGAIFNQGTLTATNVSFLNNAATIPCVPPHCHAFTTGGGAIFNQGGRVTIANSLISTNSAVYGGGILNYSGSAKIRRCVFINDNNGAVQINRGTVTIQDTTFNENLGSAVANEAGILTISGSTFVGNSTNGLGAGLFNAGQATITNSTFTNNSVTGSSSFGGAISNEGTLTIVASTIAGNSADFGGGIDNVNTLNIKSTIVAASAGGDCDLETGSASDGGYNIADDSSCGFGATGSLNSTDPMLDPAGLQNNGGQTQTIALLDGSPAIDAIPVANCTDQASPPNPLITDQRLFPRPDGGEVNCDIGAYEVQDTPFIPFSRFRGSLTIDSNTRVLNLTGSFKLGRGGSIDPATQPVAFSVGKNALRLPVGSFVQNAIGYVFQTMIGKSFLSVTIEFTNTPGSYRLLVFQQRGPQFTGPVPVTLTIGDNSGSTQMNVKFD